MPLQVFSILRTSAFCGKNSIHNSNTMSVCVCVVSGGCIVTQLAILQHLFEAEYSPDISLGASGGNIAIYVSIAGDRTWSGIERIARKLTPQLLFTHRSMIPGLGKFLGLFADSVYGPGTGAGKLFQDHIHPDILNQHEVWTSTFNRSQDKAQIFCNLSQEQSKLNTNVIDTGLTHSLPAVYLNNDLDKAATVCLASASVPVLIPPVTIDNELHIDGGMGGASPLTTLYEAIVDYGRRQQQLHLTYVNIIDLEQPLQVPNCGLINAIRQAGKCAIRTLLNTDRFLAFTLLESLVCVDRDYKRYEVKVKCNLASMRYFVNIREHLKYSMLECYPGKIYELDMFNFTEADIVRLLHEAYADIYCRFIWWSRDKCQAESILRHCRHLCENGSTSLSF